MTFINGELVPRLQESGSRRGGGRRKARRGWIYFTRKLANLGAVALAACFLSAFGFSPCPSFLSPTSTLPTYAAYIHSSTLAIHAPTHPRTHLDTLHNPRIARAPPPSFHHTRIGDHTHSPMVFLGLAGSAGSYAIATGSFPPLPPPPDPRPSSLSARRALTHPTFFSPTPVAQHPTPSAQTPPPPPLKPFSPVALLV